MTCWISADWLLPWLPCEHRKMLTGKPSVFNRRCSWFPPHSNSPRNNCSTPLSCSAIRRRIFNRREIPCRESSFSRRLRHDSMPTRKKIGLSGVTPYLLDICPTASRANETGRHQVDKHAKKAVGPMFQKADPDHMLSHGTTYVRISWGRVGCCSRWSSRASGRNFSTLARDARFECTPLYGLEDLSW